MEFRILGPLEVRDGERMLALGGARRRAVLGLLLLEANRVVPVDRLVDGVWGDSPPASAHASLQNQLARLRQQLGDRLVTRSPGYLVRVAPDELDLDRFRRLVDEAQGADPAVASERLRDALALWRGPPLADLAGEPAGRAAAHLDELRLAALEARIEADLGLGRHAALVPELEELVAREPYRERLRGQLLLALYRSGRQADALEAYAGARRTFADELGTDPGRELHDLHLAVLRRDPALDAPVGAEPPSAPAHRVEERRTVTVLAADVVPDDVSADPEARRAQLRERSAAVESELASQGATVQPLGGGQLLGVFGVPAASDDDSLRAVRAALALRSGGLARRVGLATGEVVTGDPFVAGAPVDEALALRDAAPPGEVRADARTLRLVRHAVAAAERDGAWAIGSVDADAAPLLRRLETPLVGRERELWQVTEDFERAAAVGRPHLVTVFGAPGVGKTRLAVECVARLRDLATAAVGRCVAGAEEVTYAPLLDVLTALAEGDTAAWVRARLAAEQNEGPPAQRLLAAVGLGVGLGRPEETAWDARRLLAGLARERPLLLVLEDVHWAAPAFLDLVESLVELARAPILVLCLARPELLEVRPHWGGGRLSSSSILLDALTDEESELMLDRLSSDGSLDAAARGRIIEIAEGNPLFIEQLLAAALEGEEDAVPDSIHTLLAARLDRLDELDRSVAQAAAVSGTSFRTEEVAELLEADPVPSLVTLVRRELIRPGEPGDPGGEGWSFRHGLIREVAYGSLPKWRRAELHERLARRAIERGGDVDVSAGLHLYRAAVARREAGERGAAVDELAARAAEHLQRAGVAAHESDDMAGAVSLLGRAHELLPRAAPEQVDVLMRLAEALVFTGELGQGMQLLDEANAVAEEVQDARLIARARLTAGSTRLWNEISVPPQQMLDEVERAFPVLEQAGDYEGLAIAEMVRFNALDRARLPGPEERLPIALEYARKAGARHLERHVMGWIAITLPRSTVPVPDALARVNELHEAALGKGWAPMLGAEGLLRGMQGDFDAARALVQEDRRILVELGLRQAAAAHSIAIAEVEIMAGDYAAAERILRAGYEAVTALRDGHGAMNVAWRLGLVLARQESDDEAERFALIAAAAQPSGFWVDLWWRVVLALVESHRGETERVRELVGEVSTMLATVAESGMHADVLLELGEALRAAGLDDEAAPLVAEAARIGERLGYTVAVRRALTQLRARPGAGQPGSTG